MRNIIGELTPGLADTVGTQTVAKAESIQVQSYRRLMEHMAQLSYVNKDYLLFFRGQAIDYKNKAGGQA